MGVADERLIQMRSESAIVSNIRIRACVISLLLADLFEDGCTWLRGVVNRYLLRTSCMNFKSSTHRLQWQ